MSKGKDLTLISRNAKIQLMRDEGRTLQAIADTVGISKGRVCQILAELDDEDLSTDGYRAFLRTQLEIALMKNIEIIKKPPPKKVSAGGKVMYEPDTDDPSGRTPDYSRPLYDDSVQVDATKAVGPLAAQLSKLMALDKRPPRDVVDENAVNEEASYVQQIIDERKRLADKLLEYGVTLEPLTPYTGYYAEIISPDESQEDSPG